jgi:hypothetical protein
LFDLGKPVPSAKITDLSKPILDRIITTQTPLNTKEAIRFYEEYDESDAI